MIHWWLFPTIYTVLIVLAVIWVGCGNNDMPFKEMLAFAVAVFGAVGAAAVWAIGLVAGGFL
jgi:hypothetical protein